ncbi:MAG: large ribosomal subunit protein uL5 [Minisyncoccia bacterium]
MATYNINPKLINKIVINVGIGRLKTLSQFEEKVVPDLVRDLSLITGQKPIITIAKKSIAGFKIRQGDAVGLKVTLRGKRAADFLVRLINIALPRAKDFHGIAKTQIDSNGNLNIGIKEHHIFPEINLDQSKVNFGLQVTIVPNKTKKFDAFEFYRRLEIPFKK